MFLRRETIGAAGRFDENLGLGAESPWWAGEETDYLIRVLERGYALGYVPGLCIFHPPSPRHVSSMALRRTRGSGRGMGRVMRKHGFDLLSTALFCTRPLLGAILEFLAGDSGHARHCWQSFLGRVEGVAGRCLSFSPARVRHEAGIVKPGAS